MSEKKNFILRIDYETYKALEKWAADEFRSVNGQIEWIIARALTETKRKNETDKSKKQTGKPKYLVEEKTQQSTHNTQHSS